jgi:hypothetical protein
MGQRPTHVSGFDHGLIAAALFLLMPARHEIVM